MGSGTKRLANVAPCVVGIVLTTGLSEFFRVHAQSEAAQTRFEVASVKACKGDPGGLERRVGDSSPGRLTTGCDFLVDENNLGLIQRAYVMFAGGHRNPFGIMTIKGGPPWIHSETFKIDARAQGHPSKEVMQGPMLQTLLEDRFKLKIHRETEEKPVYILTLNKDDSRLKPFVEGSCVQMPYTQPPPELKAGQRYCANMISARRPSIDAEGITARDFSKLLDLVVDRPVIDRTGLAGKYDFHLKFSRDDFTSRLPPSPPGMFAGNSEPSAPSIFTAVQEQLGLKLTSGKGAVEFLVIDHVEPPTEN